MYIVDVWRHRCSCSPVALCSSLQFDAHGAHSENGLNQFVPIFSFRQVFWCAPRFSFAGAPKSTAWDRVQFPTNRAQSHGLSLGSSGAAGLWTWPQPGARAKWGDIGTAVWKGRVTSLRACLLPTPVARDRRESKKWRC